MSKITPGPWEVTKPQVGFIDVFEEEWTIYPPIGHSGPIALVSSEANARLIAAAPELLSALIELVEWVTLDMVEMQRAGHTVSHLAQACDKARVAISEALDDEH